MHACSSGFCCFVFHWCLLGHHLTMWVFPISWEAYLQSSQASLWEHMAWDPGVWDFWRMSACVSLGHAQHWQPCRIWTSSTSFIKSMSFQKKLYRFISPSTMIKPLLHILSKTSCFPNLVGTVVANLVALKFASPYLLLCRSFHVFIRHLGFDFFFSCAGPSLLLKLSLVAKSGATLHCGAWSSHCSSFPCWGAQALGVWAAVLAARGPSSCGSWAYRSRWCDHPPRARHAGMWSQVKSMWSQVLIRIWIPMPWERLL